MLTSLKPVIICWMRGGVKRYGVENVAKFYFEFLGEDLPGF